MVYVSAIYQKMNYECSAVPYAAPVLLRCCSELQVKYSKPLPYSSIPVLRLLDKSHRGTIGGGVARVAPIDESTITIELNSPRIKDSNIITLGEAKSGTDIKLVVREQSAGVEVERAVMAYHDVGCRRGVVERVDHVVGEVGFDLVLGVIDVSNSVKDCIDDSLGEFDDVADLADCSAGNVGWCGLNGHVFDCGLVRCWGGGSLGNEEEG